MTRRSATAIELAFTALLVVGYVLLPFERAYRYAREALS